MTVLSARAHAHDHALLIVFMVVKDTGAAVENPADDSKTNEATAITPASVSPYTHPSYAASHFNSLVDVQTHTENTEEIAGRGDSSKGIQSTVPLRPSWCKVLCLDVVHKLTALFAPLTCYFLQKATTSDGQEELPESSSRGLASKGKNKVDSSHSVHHSLHKFHISI